MLLALGSCHSNLRLFNRGSVIGGEPISSRAPAAINQRAVLVTGYNRLPGRTQILAPISKKLGQEIKVRSRSLATGFVTTNSGTDGDR